jgi:hypothetical protein
MQGGLGAAEKADAAYAKMREQEAKEIARSIEIRKKRNDKADQTVGQYASGAEKPEWSKNLDEMARAAGSTIGPIGLLAAGLYKVNQIIDNISTAKEKMGNVAARQIGDINEFAGRVEQAKVGFSAGDVVAALKNSPNQDTTRAIFSEAVSFRNKNMFALPTNITRLALQAASKGNTAADIIPQMAQYGFPQLQRMANRRPSDTPELTMRAQESALDIEAAEINVEREGNYYRDRENMDRFLEKATPGSSSLLPRRIMGVDLLGMTASSGEGIQPTKLGTSSNPVYVKTVDKAPNSTAGR